MSPRTVIAEDNIIRVISKARFKHSISKHHITMTFSEDSTLKKGDSYRNWMLFLQWYNLKGNSRAFSIYSLHYIPTWITTLFLIAGVYGVFFRLSNLRNTTWRTKCSMYTTTRNRMVMATWRMCQTVYHLCELQCQVNVNLFRQPTCGTMGAYCLVCVKRNKDALVDFRDHKKAAYHQETLEK
jgi:hypothetical protein